ncbi:hypothetical protein I6I97_15085 [Sphingobacterium multivorum]|uniref:hypothetical protein n=1 Tax=Sphingobacterium TaxID=28453 RepID=UPI0011C06132|nr:hypothetical protein [Sphingobacterium multivorum]QQT46907.1 hypothetical protein I6J00_09725 [Sphingobacterium multivorum]QQT60552.1 hypothetical protein I6I97_15085 [Sphingobacterium multivorum]
MEYVQKQMVSDIEDIYWPLTGRQLLGIVLACLLLFFILSGFLLQAIDPTAGVLDLGTLSLLLFGILAGLAAIYCCFWLQEMLWQPFKFFRQEFSLHFNQLTSWQQCIIYFSVFFLSLFSFLAVLAILL